MIAFSNLTSGFLSDINLILSRISGYGNVSGTFENLKQRGNEHNHVATSIKTPAVLVVLYEGCHLRNKTEERITMRKLLKCRKVAFLSAEDSKWVCPHRDALINVKEAIIREVILYEPLKKSEKWLYRCR